jgi:hypothetical protein
MSTHFKDIRAAIKKVIDDNSEKISVVYNYERSTFEEFPAAIVVPTDNEAEYGSTATDRLVFVFKIRAYYPIPDEGEHEDAEAALEEVVDELLDLFHSKGVLGSACDWVEPIPGTWFYETRGEGVYRGAEMTLRCIKHW